MDLALAVSLIVAALTVGLIVGGLRRRNVSLGMVAEAEEEARRIREEADTAAAAHVLETEAEGRERRDRETRLARRGEDRRNRASRGERDPG